MHSRNFGCDVSVRPPVHSLGGGEKGIRCQPIEGEEYAIFSRREICATRVFLGGKSRKKWRGHCRRVEKLVYFRNSFSTISWRKDFVTLVLSF